jgi:hypothetical protein
MRSHFKLVLSLLAGLLGFNAAAAGSPITTGTLLREMADLERLARWPDPVYRTVQFSSYDRRSTTPEAPGWFSNADGFGREPIPGFLKVLREPDNTGLGSTGGGSQRAGGDCARMVGGDGRRAARLRGPAGEAAAGTRPA